VLAGGGWHKGGMPKVRDAIRLAERDGWVFVRMRGSHRIYRHPTKLGRMLFAGSAGKDVPAGLWDEILHQAGLDRS